MYNGVDVIEVAAEFVYVRDVCDDRLSVRVILDVETRELLLVRFSKLVNNSAPDRAVRPRNEHVHTARGA